MSAHGPPSAVVDIDIVETREWIESFDALIHAQDSTRALFLLRRLEEHAKELGLLSAAAPYSAYRNTAPLARQGSYPGDLALEEPLTSIMRWNALAMVTRANKAYGELGGHIASYASAAEIFEVGFNHFFQAARQGHGGRFGLLPAPFGTGHLRTRLSRGRLSDRRPNLTIRPNELQRSCEHRIGLPMASGPKRNFKRTTSGANARKVLMAGLSELRKIEADLDMPGALGVFIRRQNGFIAATLSRDCSCKGDIMMLNASLPPQTQLRAGISSHAFLLALATFAIGTDAFIIAGILPQISHDLTVTISSAGLVVSVFSISYAVGAPIVSALFSRIPRKAILVGGLAVFMVANILSAISPTLPVLLLTRIIAALAAGLVAPACYAAAAAGLGSEKDRGKNLAIIAAGFTSSTVLGVPLGVFISHFFTWRGSMGFVALLAFIAAVALLTAGIPASKGTEAPASLRQQAQAIGRWQTLFVLTPFLVWSAANFGLYTYIAALLGQRLPANLIPFLLLAFGIGGVIGNMLGGILSDHVGVRRPTFCLLAVLIVTLASVGFAVGTALLAGLVMVVWAASMSALFTLQQQRAIAVSPKQSNLMLALNNSALYFGAAIGSAIEGTIISQASLNLAPPASAVMAALSLVLLFLLPQPTTARDRSSASNGKSDTAACN